MPVLVDRDIEKILYNPEELWKENIKPNALDLKVEDIFYKHRGIWKNYEPVDDVYTLKKNTPYKVKFAEKIRIIPGYQYSICERSTLGRLGMQVENKGCTLTDDNYAQFMAEVRLLFFPIAISKNKSRISQLIIKNDKKDFSKKQINRNHKKYVRTLSEEYEELKTKDYLENGNVVFNLKSTHVLESKPSKKPIHIDAEKRYMAEDYWKKLDLNNELELKKDRI